MGNIPGSGSGGLLAATKNSAATLLASGRARLELLGNEIREEKIHAVSILLLAQMVAFCLMVGSILTVLLLVVLFWDNRVVVLGGFTALFLAGGGFAYLSLRRSMSDPRRIFASSISELEEDLRQLKGTAGNESRTD